MFERFTEPARATVAEAVDLAASHGSRLVGREHLLVALASRGEPTLVAVVPDAGTTLSALLSQESPDAQDHADAQALAAVGIDLDAIRASVAETIGPDAWNDGAPGRRRPSSLIARLLPDHRPFTPGARKALELALRETIAEGSREITATHLLRGLLRDPGPHVMAILAPDLVAELRSRLHRPGRSIGGGMQPSSGQTCGVRQPPGSHPIRPGHLEREGRKSATAGAHHDQAEHPFPLIQPADLSVQ
jgi:ATP-dependent Clp protease ATP-binding subunit ClpA